MQNAHIIIKKVRKVIAYYHFFVFIWLLCVFFRIFAKTTYLLTKSYYLTMKKLLRFSLTMMLLVLAIVANAAKASYANGKLTIDLIGDWATVEAGSGNITVVDAEGVQVAAVIGDLDYDYSNTSDYQVIVYNLSGKLDAGKYTVKVAAGALRGDKTDPWSWSLVSIPAFELPLEVGESGGDTGNTTDGVSLGTPSFELIAGSGINVKYTYPNSDEGENINKESTELPVVLYENGTEVATANFGFQMEPTFFYGVHFDYVAVKGAEYSVVFPKGSWLISSIEDGTILTVSEEQKYTWTADQDGQTPGDGPSADGGWLFAGVTPAEGEVESLSKISFSYPAGVPWVNQSATLNIVCPNGNTAEILLNDNFFGACDGTILDQVLTAPGTYTLTIPAGTFTAGEGDACAAMTYTWTIAGGGNNPSDDPNTPGGDFAGDKWQEKLFSNGDLGNKMIEVEKVEGTGVTMTAKSFYNEMLDFNVPVRYNTNEEGKINWNSGTQLIFTAKDVVTGIVIDGDFAQFASADKGMYNNGVWKGTLAVGESVTLTANDGININSIVVLYNGDELEEEEVDEVTVEINLDITKTDWSIIGKTNGEVIGTVSSNTPNFDHYMFSIICDDDADEFISFNDLLSIDGNIVCTSPTANGYDLFNGHNYTFTVFVYDSPQFGAVPVAAKTFKFVGTGKEAVKYNTEITVAGLGLTPNTSGVADYNVSGDSFEIAFTAPVTNVQSFVAMGFAGYKNLTATQKSEDGTVWTLTLPESILNEEGAVNVQILAFDTDGNPLKVACADTPYAFNLMIDLSNEPIYAPVMATITIDGKVINLNEEEAVTITTIPKGSLFTYYNMDQSIHHVTWQIDNVKVGASIKSIADMVKGENGVWTGETSSLIDYNLANGDEYVIKVVARNSVSNFSTTNIVDSRSYSIMGDADVASYSDVNFVSITPNTNDVIDEAPTVITLTFDAPLASVTARYNANQMDIRDLGPCTPNEDKTQWSYTLSQDFLDATGGVVSLRFAAIDEKGNRVCTNKEALPNPETVELTFSYVTVFGLPVPTLVQDGKSYPTVAKLDFMNKAGIGLNQDNTTATWKNIVIAKDGVPMNIAITESMFKIYGDESVGGTQLTLTLPDTLYAGEYTVTVPAFAFMLGADQNNNYSGNCEFTFTATEPAPAPKPYLVVNLTKTSWATLGNQNGEVIGTAKLENADAFDHIEAEIRCVEAPSQYITFSNVNTNGGNIVCYTWEGGHYDMNYGYHYLLIVKAFDVPYYGVEPIATDTIEVVGAGSEAVKYSDVEVVKLELKENPLLYHGYDINGTTFDVVFSEPVRIVSAWGAMGFDGSLSFSAQKKSEDGTVWTIVMPETVLSLEGSINVMIKAWDADYLMSRGWNGEHAFDFNLSISPADDPTAIKSMNIAADASVYTLSGVRINAAQMKKGDIYIINGVKVRR